MSLNVAQCSGVLLRLLCKVTTIKLHLNKFETFILSAYPNSVILRRELADRLSPDMIAAMNKDKEFELYFKRYYTPLGMYVLRICGDTSVTEDIVQEAFSILWQKSRDEDFPDNFRSYLYRTAHNLTIDHLRKNQSNFSTIPLSDIEDSLPTEEDIDTSERDARLWQAISRLPQRCREVFLLSKQDGLSNAQIAEKLGISPKTVEAQMTKAFKALRESLSPTSGRVFFLPFL